MAPSPRKTIKAEVIQVAEQAKTLDPIVETSEVQRMINQHNSQTKSGKFLEIKRTVFYTGYFLTPMDTANLLTLVKLPPNSNESDIKYLANNVLITFGPAQPHVFAKVGSIGSKQAWQVTGFGLWENRVWAARIAPVPPTSQIHTDNHVPLVLLAHHRAARPADANRIQNWQPVSADKQYVFQTTVDEKVQLRIEPAVDGESEYDNIYPRQNLKRRHTPPQQNFRGDHGNEPNGRPNGANGGPRGGYQNRTRGGGGGRGNTNNNRGRAGASGRGGGGNNRGRGSGLRGSYRSLDDVGTVSARYNAQRSEPNYDDYVPNGEGYNATFPALGGGLPYGK